MAVFGWASVRLLWLFAIPAEAAAGWALIGGSGTTSPLGTLLVAGGFLLHVAASAAFGFSLTGAPGDGDGRAWPLLGWTLSLVVFPLLGMLAVAVAFVLRSTARASERTAEEMEPEAMTGGESDVVRRARAVEVSLLEEREVEPVVDVLQEDDPEAKRAAIDALTRLGGEETVRLLTRLLHDPSPEARLFASLSLSRLEDEIGRSILEAQRELEGDPGSPERRERLADLYLDYVMSGFLEGAARDFYLRLAREAYEGVPGSGGAAGDVALKLARVHLLLGEIAQAADLLDELSRERPDDLDVRLARMEVIYEFGDLRELRLYARRALPKVPNDAPERALFEWWAAGEAGLAH